MLTCGTPFRAITAIPCPRHGAPQQLTCPKAAAVSPRRDPQMSRFATFSAFGKAVKWGSLVTAAVIVALVLWFCVPAGFFTGLVSAIVVLAVGIFFLRAKPNSGH